jgi:hypothetical protein
MTSKEHLDVRETLPAKNFVVLFNPSTKEYYLEEINPFSLPKKMYGNVIRHTDRILNTFLNRENSTGVLLTGEKGSGKTLLSKSISLKAAELGMPTIIVNQNWHGDDFNKFIQNIEQPAIILFDEFEKVYWDEEHQQAILTLFDGVYQSKKLFMCTCNDDTKLDKNLKNRPGRLYYLIEFSGLDTSFVREYCEDNLLDKSKIPSICNISYFFSDFNFDMLQSIVEEINRYGEDVKDVIRMLNTKFKFGKPTKYRINWNPNPELNAEKKSTQKTFVGNPYENDVYLGYYDPVAGYTKDCYYEPDDITGVDERGSIIYNNINGTLILTREKTVLVEAQAEGA